MSKIEIIEKVKNTNKKIYLTIGYKWKNPTTLEKLLPKEEVIGHINWSAIAKIEKETEDSIYIQCYSWQDMGD